MFGAEIIATVSNLPSYYDMNQAQQAGAIPQEYMIPNIRIPNPWGGDCASQKAVLDEDFIMIAEFSEIEGPKPVILIPKGGGGDFDLNEFALKIMAIDHQSSVSSGFHIYGDTQVVRTDWDQGVYAFVHHFVLHDHHARGFVRPFSMSYITQDYRKLMSFYEDFSLLMQKVSELLRYGNRLVFVKDLECHLKDLEHTKEVLINRNGKTLETSLEGDDQHNSLKLLKQVENSSREVSNILSMLRPLLNDKKLEEKFNRLEEKAKSDSKNMKNAVFVSSFQDCDLDVEHDENKHSTSGSLRDSSSCESLLSWNPTDYKPKVIEIDGRKKFDKALRGFHQLCSWGAREGMQRLRSLLEHFSKELAVLELERLDSYLLDPPSSLLSFSHGAVGANLLTDIDMLCVGTNCSLTRRMGPCPPRYMERWSSLETIDSFKSATSSCSSVDDENETMTSAQSSFLDTQTSQASASVSEASFYEVLGSLPDDHRTTLQPTTHTPLSSSSPPLDSENTSDKQLIDRPKQLFYDYKRDSLLYKDDSEYSESLNHFRISNFGSEKIDSKKPTAVQDDSSRKIVLDSEDQTPPLHSESHCGVNLVEEQSALNCKRETFEEDKNFLNERKALFKAMSYVDKIVASEDQCDSGSSVTLCDLDLSGEHPRMNRRKSDSSITKTCHCEEGTGSLPQESTSNSFLLDISGSEDNTIVELDNSSSSAYMTAVLDSQQTHSEPTSQKSDGSSLKSEEDRETESEHSKLDSELYLCDKSMTNVSVDKAEFCDTHVLETDIGIAHSHAQDPITELHCDIINSSNIPESTIEHNQNERNARMQSASYISDNIMPGILEQNFSTKNEDTKSYIMKLPNRSSLLAESIEKETNRSISTDSGYNIGSSFSSNDTPTVECSHGTDWYNKPENTDGNDELSPTTGDEDLSVFVPSLTTSLRKDDELLFNTADITMTTSCPAFTVRKLALLSDSDSPDDRLFSPFFTGPFLHKLLNSYLNLQHVIYSLLIGRPVVVMGTAKYEMEVREVVHALRVFLPSFNRQSPQYSDWFQTKQLRLSDLSHFRLCGMCRPDKKNIEQVIMRSIKKFVTVLDVEKRVIQSPLYQGDFVYGILNKRKVFKTEEALNTYIEMCLVELSCKAFIFYHYCLQTDVCANSGETMTKQISHISESTQNFLVKLGIYNNDCQILQYLADVIKFQQLEEHHKLVTSTELPVRPLPVTYSPCQLFRC